MRSKSTFIVFLAPFLLPISLFAVNVSGTVSDAATGNALAGANVVEGTDLGAAAGGDGSYSIARVHAGATITASMIGYTSASTTAAPTVNFALEAGVIAGEELVVIGYGTQSRKDVTGAISSLNEDSFTKGTNADLQSMLQAGSQA